MTEAARIRIGRIRLKAGGATLHLLPRQDRTPVVQHMREWMASALDGPPPDAYAAVALWFDPQEPGRPTQIVGFCTRHDALPAPVLCRVAADYLAEESALQRTCAFTLHNLGYDGSGWEPDGAS